MRRYALALAVLIAVGAACDVASSVSTADLARWGYPAIRSEGAQSYREGRPVDSNPWPGVLPGAARAWRDGWTQAEYHSLNGGAAGE